MQKIVIAILFLFTFTFQAYSAEKPDDFNKNWAQWRGPEANGSASQGNPPIEWSETKNIRWKIEIPGKGHATPIIWDDKVFIQTAIPTEKDIIPNMENQNPPPPPNQGRGMPSVKTTKICKFVIIAINRKDGKTIWEKTLNEAIPHEATHEEGSWASNSPVTDGEHIYAYFGSRGLYCLDMKGNVVWSKDFGDMKIKMAFGEGSSPAIYDNTIVINWDNEEKSFIVALDKKTGDEIWRKDRDEKTSWSTPLIVEHKGKPQVIVSATSRIRSYDLANGDLIWECGGMTQNAIPSPVYADGIVYLMGGFRGNALFAIQLDKALGDITNTDAILWKYDKDTPYSPSPLLYKGGLYFMLSNEGVLSCFDAKTGQPFYSRAKLNGINGFFSSPVSAGDHVYLLGKNGVTVVIKSGSKFEVVATNTLQDNFTASPAVVGNEIYLRGYKNLYCISQ
jgi:outer membrane protein assembly factor BamB